MARRSLGNGDQGPQLDIALVPDSTFETEIAALIAAGTQVAGKLVALTFSNNYECTSPAANAIPMGKIIDWIKDPVYGYILTVRMFNYIDQNNNNHTAVKIVEIPYEGTIALQDSIIVYNSDYDSVDDGTSGGWGAVISKNTTSAKVDVLV